MVRTLTDTIATTLRGGAHTLERSSTIDEDAGDIELTVFGLASVLLFPVSDSRAEELLHASSGFLVRELEYPKSTTYFHATHEVSYEAHLTRRRRDIAERSEVRRLQGLLSFFG